MRFAEQNKRRVNPRYFLKEAVEPDLSYDPEDAAQYNYMADVSKIVGKVTSKEEQRMVRQGQFYGYPAEDTAQRITKRRERKERLAAKQVPAKPEEKPSASLPAKAGDKMKKPAAKKTDGSFSQLWNPYAKQREIDLGTTEFTVDKAKQATKTAMKPKADPNIKKLQIILQSMLGIYNGPINGVVNNKLVDAVAKMSGVGKQFVTAQQIKDNSENYLMIANDLKKQKYAEFGRGIEKTTQQMQAASEEAERKAKERFKDLPTPPASATLPQIDESIKRENSYDKIKNKKSIKLYNALIK